jgi:hypothetical protein
MVLGLSPLTKRPCTHALTTQYQCFFGSKQPSPLATSTIIQAPKCTLESIYLSKVTAQDQMLFANLDWSIPNTPSLLSSHLEHYLSVSANTCGTGTLQDLQLHTISPLILAAKTAATKEDNPTWWQAMNGPYAEEYWKAAQIEVVTLEQIQAWTVVPRTDDITEILPSTWAFKVKCYPDGSINKFKGCFCARGDKQIHRVDFFETYSPVVQWTTICLMLVLECTWAYARSKGTSPAPSYMPLLVKMKLFTLRCLKASSNRTNMGSPRSSS